jgi:hypothetical protein
VVTDPIAFMYCNTQQNAHREDKPNTSEHERFISVSASDG